jgi:phage baseplate assembly protein V
MNLLDMINRAIQPVANRLRNLVVRAVVNSVDDSGKWQRAQIEASDGETLSGVPVFQPYGFSSNAPVAAGGDGPEALVVRIGGRPDNSVIIAIGDRRYRLPNLAAEEVAMYDAQGSIVKCQSNGDINLKPGSGTVTVTGDVVVSGNVTASGDLISQTGNVQAQGGDVLGHSATLGADISLIGHKHNVAAVADTSTGAVTFTPPAKTGSPTP